jgi:chloramphenicol-sensitive protein RarD
VRAVERLRVTSTTTHPSTVGTARNAEASRRAGALAAALCYFLWGLVPLYWRHLASVNPVELIAHRTVWSLALLAVLVVVQRSSGHVAAAFQTPRSLAINTLSAALLTANWLVYVWGVNTGHVIETSLGYFLVPLVNVATGRFVLHEHLRRAQWIAIILAVVGVALMFVQLGRPPWIALTLAGTWGGYSLMRKQSPLPPVVGLTVETLLLAPLAIGFLVWRHHTGEGVLGRVDLRMHVLVVSAGIITAVPLLLFAYGARRIRLSTLGLLQYLAPTVQLILGVWVFHEPFSESRVISFSFIWAALALYTADNVLAQSRQMRVFEGKPS